MSDDLRYPVGKFRFPDSSSDSERETLLQQIADTPSKLREAVAGLDDDQLATPYRPDGWTVRQVVHHLADSHMNSYVRFKLAATEDTPTVKGYDEAIWAGLEDAQNAPVETSLQLLESLHERWLQFLRSLDAEGLARTFKHSELGSVTIAQNIALYAWHGRHHVGHITALREREGW